MPAELIDIGANLTHDSFDADRDAVIDRARAAGVGRIVVTGADLEHSRTAAMLAAQRPGILYATAGVHPHHASGFSNDVGRLVGVLLRQPCVVAAGECGLDYFRNFSSREAQLEAFAAQIDLAREAGKPLFLHQRDAHEDLVAVLDEFSADLPRAVVHCFTGSRHELDDYLDRGLHIGITGWICDERRGRHLLELLPHIPANRMMIETDAPYLLPRDIVPRPPTRRNEPSWLTHIAATVARARGETPAETAEHTSATATAFFDLEKAGARIE